VDTECTATVVAVPVGDEYLREWWPADALEVRHSRDVVVLVVPARVHEHGGVCTLYQVHVRGRDAEGLPSVGKLMDAGFKFQVIPPYSVDVGLCRGKVSRWQQKP
jgi:hypothetical protein